VVFTQNHDQVGNRAAGERSGALMSEGRLRVAAALLLTSPFVPLLFQGEEWGAATPFQYFTGHPDLELGRAVSEGRRSEFAAFGWDPADVPDPQDPATFERSRLDWAEIHSERHASLLAWYRRLIALRGQVPALTDPRPGRTETDYDSGAGWLVVRRGPVTVAANLGAGAWTFPAGPAESLLAASDPRVEPADQGLLLPPDTVAILKRYTAPP
jgi:maltooligosyltrehalose trehalohydrolase